MNAYLWNEVLTRICTMPELEGQWLGVLSLLEYVGCRKILKSVAYTDVDLSVLKHIHDESLHALALKRLSVGKAGEGAFGSGLFDTAGWEYFQAVDRLTTDIVAEEKPAYPVVSWIIERRVFRVYPFYKEVTSDPAVKSVLESILVQEREHRAHFEAVSLPESLKNQVTDSEEEAWEKFVLAIEKLVPPAPSSLRI